MECSASGNWSQGMPSCAGIYFLANAEFGSFFWEPIQDIFSLGSIFVTIVVRIFWEPKFLAGLPLLFIH